MFHTTKKLIEDFKAKGTNLSEEEAGNMMLAKLAIALNLTASNQKPERI
ncbi:hypothetical protein [Pedobacter metabolipauper]|uniref:Uncharacterized protein n=1 Tax=Pedobacter metabolipauper TaxID=425513 RepID=A0A4R6SUW3_9SPHI|nr:hypothetical protein [Pedobacter metabolipauper]TDQ08229.1 hypothetical protein ATK78_2737 [Pedobacter metabolipauper]